MRSLIGNNIWVLQPKRMRKVYKFILSELAKPIIRRLGTAMSGTLVGLGIAADQAVQVETAATALLLIVADLILSGMERRKEDD